MENRYVLITGASSGIGYELAKVFAENGHNLILVSRSIENLNTVADEFRRHGVAVFPIAKDLFEPNAAFELYQEVKSQGFTVDILVNDAGQGEYGIFVDTNIERQLQIIQLNVSSLTALTYLFLKEMVLRNEGKVLQVASIGSNFPGPFQAVYHATKAYVLSFTEALVNEVKDTEVTITALQPGVTDTDFFNKAGAQNSKLVEDKSKMSDPATVARDGYNALMQGKNKIVSGLKNKVMVGMSHLMPDQMSAEQIRQMSKEQDQSESKPKSIAVPLLSTVLLAGLGAGAWYVRQRSKMLDRSNVTRVKKVITTQGSEFSAITTKFMLVNWVLRKPQGPLRVTLRGNSPEDSELQGTMSVFFPNQSHSKRTLSFEGCISVVHRNSSIEFEWNKETIVPITTNFVFVSSVLRKPQGPLRVTLRRHPRVTRRGL